MHEGPQGPGLAASSFGHTDWERPIPLSQHCLSLQSTGCWEAGRGSAFNLGNPSQGELTFEGLHSLVLSWPLSTLSPTCEHGPSTSAISSRLVTAHVPPSPFCSQSPPAGAVFTPRFHFSRSCQTSKPCWSLSTFLNPAQGPVSSPPLNFHHAGGSVP